VGFRSLHGDPTGRVLAKKVQAKRIWLRCTNKNIFLAQPPE